MSPAAPKPDGGLNLADRPARTSAGSDPVKIFQAAHGLVVDGIAGPLTLAAGYQPQPGVSLSPTPSGGSTAPGAGAMRGVSAADWHLVQTIGQKYGVDPYILVAIGLHETQWGTAGAGRQGYTLGVGVPDGGGLQTQYQGLSAQLDQAARILVRNGVHNIQDIAAGKLAPSNGQVKYASDPGWSNNVIGIYNQIRGSSVGTGPSTAGGGGPGAGPIGPVGPNSTPGGGSGGGLPAAPYDPAKFAAALQSAGFATGLINSDKSLKDLFAKAVHQHLDPTEFLSALENTPWFQKRNASQRSFDELKFSDPNTFNRQLAMKSADIHAQATALGVTMTPARLALLTNTALRNGLTAQELQASIGAELHYNPRVAYGGTLGQTVNQLKQAASDYYVTLDDKTLGQFATQVTSGTTTVDHWTNFLKAQAASKFPWLKDQIDQGFTIAQLANPYKQEMAKTLEIDPGGINNADTTVLKGLQYQDPANMKGGFTTMPLYKFSDALRQDPRWLHTDNARNSAMDTATGVLHDMGLVS